MNFLANQDIKSLQGLMWGNWRLKKTDRVSALLELI